MPTITVHRTAFWSAPQKRILRDTIQREKRVVTVSLDHNDTHPVVFTFADGSTYSADALVGCDGINSFVRYHVLGADHPATKAYYTKRYSHRIVMPIADADEALGKEYCSLRTQHVWMGQGGIILTDHNNEGASMQIIVGRTSQEPWPDEAPYVEWNKARLRQELEPWGEMGKAVCQVLQYYPSSNASVDPALPLFATPEDDGPTALNQSTLATGQQQRANNTYADATIVCPSYWIAEAYSINAAGGQAYKYQFSVPPALHAYDVAVYFAEPGTIPYSSDIATAFQKIIGNFIITSDPSVPSQIANGVSISDDTNTVHAASD